ncbi:signal peptidase I SipW [Calidifontibacillus oryziterrae]|uniref:signal peptidase I SipW n=1 Tax=Calidifontibacillus oryziterrae TaxID=1191699 RepID=UPI0002E61466|nr:signal peptidase I [Calidifontibacillus oryziterrae]
MNFKVWISGIVNIILFAVLLIMALAFVLSKASGGEPNVFGYQIKTVLSGSMEPTFKTGSIIAINPDIKLEALQENDVITFRIDEQNLVTHRIIEVIKQGEAIMFRTKGDNNDAPDSDLVLPQNVVGKYTDFTIPYAGYFINFAISKMGAVFLLIVPGLLLLGYAAVSIWQAIRYLERKPDESTTKSV